MLPKKFTLKKILTILWNLLLIFAGSVLCAIAIKGILVPKEFLAGGVTGLALLGHAEYTPVCHRLDVRGQALFLVQPGGDDYFLGSDILAVSGVLC
jgi:uncharacterized membrane-anchored protein YitT (DUF2179 family)